MRKINLDMGFSYGIGLFETINIYNSKPIFLERHMERLKRGIKFFNISLDTEVVLEKVCREIVRSHIVNDGVKVMVSHDNLIIEKRDNPYTDKDRKQGFKLCYSKIMKNETSPLIYHKTLNYGDNILEKQNANKQGYDEPIFLNSKGQVTEGATTNIFLVKDGEILTPSLECGLLPGIMRQFVIDNMAVKETIITPESLEDSDEIFVTNALMGIMPVISLEDRQYAIGNVTKTLIQKYQSQLEK